jgi:peptidoglycan/LPS O-acetylase OafA/YrhL
MIALLSSRFRYMMRQKFKHILLVLCLFLFLLVVLGGALRLTPGDALLGAAIGTPLVIHVFNRWARGSDTQTSNAPSETSSSSSPNGVNGQQREARTLHGADVVRP